MHGNLPNTSTVVLFPYASILSELGCNTVLSWKIESNVFAFIRFTSASVSAFSRTVGHLVEPSIKFLTFSKSILVRQLNQMFLAINFLNIFHVCIHRVTMFIEIIRFRAGGSLGNIHQVCGMFLFHAHLLIMSFYATVSYTLLPLLCKVVLFDVCLCHTSSKCLLGSGTFLPFPLDLEGFPALPLFPLLPLFAELLLPLDFDFPFLEPFPYWT